MSITLNREQKLVIDGIITTMRNKGYGGSLHRFSDLPDLFTTTVGGYAGTGKTFLISQLRNKINNIFPKISVAFVTFTGKASSVLKHRLSESGSLYFEDYVGTIHGLIYKPEVVWDRKLKAFVIIGWTKKSSDEIPHQLIIIDEASMVSKEIWNDLKSFNKSIVSVGDHGQLPPIGDQFSLLASPDYTLTQIHRHSLNSPIIALSKFVRDEGYIPTNKYFSQEVFKLSWDHPMCQKIWNNKLNIDKDLIILCGFNTTRCYINDLIRKRLHYRHKEPYPGERLVCLANNHYIKIMNGQTGSLMWLMPEDSDLYRITLEMDDGEIYESMASNTCFGQVSYTIYEKSKKMKEQVEAAASKGFQKVDYFDYGYCISVHKSQGSEWERVVLFEQRTNHWDDEYYARWLYTAITRAKQKLFIISDFYG